MVVQEGQQVREYELIFIISPELAEEASESLINRVSQFVTDNGGTTPSLDHWGKRRLAYPIKRFTEGNYVLARFSLKSSLTKELEASLEISEEVLRHLLIRVS